MSTRNNILKIENLSVDYKHEKGCLSAVDNISFEIRQGEVFALVGESGCGKSTIAYAIPGLLKSNNANVSGKIEFDKADLTKLSQSELEKIRGTEIGMVFQNPLNSLNPVYKVGFQAAEPLLINEKAAKETAYAQVVKAFKSVRLSDVENKVNRFPHELSGGQIQRVIIGMSSMRKPRLLIADEPTTALDVTVESQIIKLVDELKTKDGEKTSVMLITHNFGTVAQIADRVGVMYAGHLVEVGDVFQIFENPKHPYTKALLRALPKITKDEGRLETIPGTVEKYMESSNECRFKNRCPLAEEICSNKRPELKQVGEDHFCACHMVKK